MSEPTAPAWCCVWIEGGKDQLKHYATEDAANRKQRWLGERTPRVVAHVYAITEHLDEETAG